MLVKAIKGERVRLIERHMIPMFEEQGYEIDETVPEIEKGPNYVTVPPKAVGVVKDGSFKIVNYEQSAPWEAKGWKVVDEYALNRYLQNKPLMPEPAPKPKPAPEPEVGDGGDEEMQLIKIKDYLENTIDHTDDDQWTVLGKPKVNMIAKALGDESITRDLVERALPGFIRNNGD